MRSPKKNNNQHSISTVIYERIQKVGEVEDSQETNRTFQSASLIKFRLISFRSPLQSTSATFVPNLDQFPQPFLSHHGQTQSLYRFLLFPSALRSVQLIRFTFRHLFDLGIQSILQIGRRLLFRFYEGFNELFNRPSRFEIVQTEIKRGKFVIDDEFVYGRSVVLYVRVQEGLRFEESSRDHGAGIGREGRGTRTEGSGRDGGFHPST